MFHLVSRDDEMKIFYLEKIDFYLDEYDNDDEI